MKNRKVIILTIWALLIIAGIVFAVKGYTITDKKTLSVSVILNNSSNDRWVSLKEGIEQAAIDRDVNVNYVSTGPIENYEAEISLINREAENGADGVIVDMCAGYKNKDAVIDVASLPIVYLDSDVAPEGSNYVVSADNYEVGKTLAEELIKVYGDGKGISVGLVAGDTGIIGISQRREGFLDALDGLNYYISWTLEGDTDSIQKKMEDMRFSREVDAIVALANDETELMIDTRIIDSDTQDSINLFGVGSSEKALYYLDKEYIHTLVVPNEFSMGYYAMNKLIDQLLAQGGGAKIETVGHIVVDHDNMYNDDVQKLLFPIVSEMSYASTKDRTEKKTNSIKIGMSLYDQYDVFISSLETSFRQYAAEYEEEKGITITIETYNASQSQITQNEQVASMIANGCDVICVNLVDRTAPSTIIELATKNDVPIIFFNRELVEEDLKLWRKLFYVGAKATESGILEGELAAEMFQENARRDKNGDGICQYYILEGETGHQDAIVRTEYAFSTLESKGVVTQKLGSAIANWNRDQAKTKVTQLIAEHSDDVELIIANNDEMALGAIDAYKAAEIPVGLWPIIVGIDGTDAAKEALANGELSATVLNDNEGQAKAMLDLAYHISTDWDLSELNLEDNKYIWLGYKKLYR